MNTGTSTVEVTIRRAENIIPALELEAEFPITGPFTVQLPTWRPGRYELGQFGQFVMGVEGCTANGWERLEKTDLHQWSVPHGVRRIRWTFAADILNAGSTCVEQGLLYVNPVNCFFYHPEHTDWAYRIVLEDVPEDWTIATALPVQDGTYIAQNMQQVMDSPIVAAKSLWHAEYEVDGVDFHIWAYGQQLPDTDRFIADHDRFTRSQIKEFGDFPASSYHFIYLFPEREVRHGVEHEDSTIIALGPSSKCATAAGYDELIGIASHELYHAWNVKRIRPSEWMPYDFSRPCPSRLGYIAEGVTTYMGDLFLLESGCIDLNTWCRLMEKLLTRHFNNPGRLNMSVADSSFDTWLDGYVAGVPGRKGSIYVEGAVLAFLCDVRIMHFTQGRASLQTAMRLLWERYGKSRIGIIAEDYWDVLNEVAGQSEALNDLRRQYAEGCDDTWDALEGALITQGFQLVQARNDEGFVSIRIHSITD